MMKHYYAALTCYETPYSIAIFKNEKDRDEWVNFEDEETIILNIKRWDDDFDREAYSEEEAAKFTEDRIYNSEFIVEDILNPEFKWVEAVFSPYWIR